MTKPPEIGRKVHVSMNTGKREFDGVVHNVLGQQFVLDEGDDRFTIFRNDNDWRYVYED